MSQDQSPNILSNVRIFAPSDHGNLNSFLQQQATGYVEPFARSRIESLARLSQRIMRHSFLRQDGASVAMAYWLRKSNLEKLLKKYEQMCTIADSLIYVPVGAVFHITPTNVDTMFVYSWVLSYLCGNRNVVRISPKGSIVIESILDVINECMQEDQDLKESNCFIYYERDESITEKLSHWCSHRIIWGGDDTIRAIRRITLNTHASERTFASKFSWAIVDAASYLESSITTQMKLAENFLTDVFTFNQMACSSPHVIFWVGDEITTSQSILLFDRLFSKIVENHPLSDDVSLTVQRRNHSFTMAASGNVSLELGQKGFTSILIKEWDTIENSICGGGLFFHTKAATIDKAISFAKEAHQTVGHFGFNQATLTSLAFALGCQGVDRLVPIGAALNFNENWDGFSLLHDFMRGVTVQIH